MTVLLPQPGRDGFDALGFDPAPGKAGNIETLSTNYMQVSQSLEQAHQALTRIGSSSGIWQGRAADNFRDTVAELPDYLDKAYRSLGDAATALDGWRTDLGSMQRTAADLERQAQQAQCQLEQAEASPDLGLAGQFFPDGESVQAAQQKLEAATKRLQAAQHELEAIREQAWRLLEQHEQLAQEVAKALERAKDIAPEEPGFFEELGETIGRALDSGIEALGEGLEQLGAASGNIIANLADVAGDISTMLSVVSGGRRACPRRRLGGRHRARRGGPRSLGHRVAGPPHRGRAGRRHPARDLRAGRARHRLQHGEPPDTRSRGGPGPVAGLPRRSGGRRRSDRG